jgi:hypothetical protein
MVNGRGKSVNAGREKKNARHFAAIKGLSVIEPR